MTQGALFSQSGTPRPASFRSPLLPDEPCADGESIEPRLAGDDDVILRLAVQLGGPRCTGDGVDFSRRVFTALWQRLPNWAAAVLGVGTALAIFFVPVKYKAFIYFQV